MPAAQHITDVSLCSPQAVSLAAAVRAVHDGYAVFWNECTVHGGAVTSRI